MRRYSIRGCIQIASTYKISMMDDVDMPTSPRKRFKTEHITVHDMEDTATLVTLVAAKKTPGDGQSEELEGQLEVRAQSTHEPEEVNHEELSTQQKEAATGILEYVRPDLPGFTGILKKRSG